MDLSVLRNYNLLTFEQVDSTNEECKRLARSGASGNFIVYSDYQTSGRGQKGRPWSSLPGNLHLSLLLESDKDLKKLTNLAFLTSVAIAEIIESIAPASSKIELKWPNDVLIDGKKVAGILMESLKVSGKQFMIIGMGVNILHTPDVPERAVTSLAEEFGYTEDPQEFMVKLVNHFDDAYLRWQADEDFAIIRREWLARAFALNEVVTIDRGQQRISGLFRGIDEAGGIVIELASGEQYTMNFGELISNQ